MKSYFLCYLNLTFYARFVVMSMSTMNTKGKSLGGGSIGTLKEWKSMYETENNNYDSAALYAEV